MTAAKIRESVGEHATPSQLHALGVSQLLAGRYDDAAQALLAASREQPANANYLNDVATVQLERARLGLRPDDLPRALASADRARRLDPSLKEAWFNRALAASALSLSADARSAWTEYLKRDNTSPWAAEAKARLQELGKPTPAQAWTTLEARLGTSLDDSTADDAVRAQTTAARNYIENVLLIGWARAAANGSGATELQKLRTMADAMLRVAGDAFYHDVVAAIDTAESRGPAAYVRLAKAHLAYAGAAVPYNDDLYVQAESGLREAQGELAEAGSPFAMRAALDLASVTYITGRYDASNALTAAALSVSRAKAYVFNTGRATWVQGLVAFAQGRLTEAQTKYEDALAEFERSNDAEQIAGAHNLIAALFYYLGDERQAWAHLTPALRGLDITRSLKLRHGLLSAAAAHTMRADRDAALAIQDEVVKNAEAWGREAAIAEALAQRASIRASLGEASAAELDLAGARELMARSEPAFRSRLEVTVLSAETDLLRTKNPAAAVQAAERAIALLQGRRDRARLAQFELKLAKANIVWGRTAEAERALERGIKAFEEERGALSDDEGRLSTLDGSFGLFETAVQLAIQKHDTERAFVMSERARVRSLAEARKVATPRTLGEIRAALGDDEAIVALNQFDDQLAIWVVRKSGAEVTTRRFTRGDAERLVARQQSEIWQDSMSVEAGRALYNEILRPVSRQLAGVTRLVVVPDATYESTSFAAMWDSTVRRYLAETVSLNLAPSANAYVTARNHKRRMADEEPLVVGGANADATMAAQAVASTYGSASLMIGGSATRSQFFAIAPTRPIVHLAVPVAVSTTNPLLSRALIADDPGLRHSGVIVGRDIADRELSGTNLVVVDEIDDHTNRGEGTLSMARAFMTAGVPAVVGTLPGADENATRDLMIAFHREMSKGVSAEQALHTVQRNAIQQNGRRLGAWSALVLYGSDR